MVANRRLSKKWVRSLGLRESESVSSRISPWRNCVRGFNPIRHCTESRSNRSTLACSESGSDADGSACHQEHSFPYSRRQSKPFRYFDKGSMATIGRNKAIADLKICLPEKDPIVARTDPS